METVTYVAEQPEDLDLIVTELLSTAVADDGLVIALQGDLGSGKTTFVQRLAKSLGIAGVITSPTFTIMKQYEVSRAPYTLLVHIDLCRIETEAEIAPLKMTELIAKPQTITCIEWPEIVPSLIPDIAMVVSIEIKEGETRLVTVGLWGG